MTRAGHGQFLNRSLTGLFRPLRLRGARIIRRETPAVHGGGRVSHITEPPAQRLPAPCAGGRPD
jgi:hypothetical protein